MGVLSFGISDLVLSASENIVKIDGPGPNEKPRFYAASPISFIKLARNY